MSSIKRVQTLIRKSSEKRCWDTANNRHSYINNTNCISPGIIWPNIYPFVIDTPERIRVQKIIKYLILQQWMTFARTWHLYDATWQNPFQSALLVKKYLCGLHKPIYHPLNDCGDHVVIVNCKEIALPGDEWRRRVYFHHTGYPGGASWTPAWELHEKNSTMVMWKAVYKSMKGNLQRRYTMCRLHLYPEDAPPEILSKVTSQIKAIRPVPKRLDTYPPELVESFPKLMDWPKDYVLPLPKENK